MGDKQGLIEKLKLCSYFLTSPSKKHVAVVTCEFCGSTNIISKNQQSENDENEFNHLKKYTADYICINCKAQCKLTQNWSKLKPETIDGIKDILKRFKK